MNPHRSATGAPSGRLRADMPTDIRSDLPRGPACAARRWPAMARALALAASLSLAAGQPAQAALIDRGGGMVYDSVQNITWLADWNLAQTSGHDADGRMDWAAANAWANGLVHGGFDDWRLPVNRQPDAGCSEVLPDPVFGPQHYGYGCSGGEMGHLFYVDLAVLAGQPITAGIAALLALFENLQIAPYWMRDESQPTPVNAWYFHTADGGLFTADKDDAWAAVAVRQGDVAAAAVPEPGALALVLLGLATAFGGPVAAGRRRTARGSA